MSSVNNIEKIRQRFSDGQVCVGSGVTFSDSAVSELIAEAGYDFTWIDAEHGPLDTHGILQHVMACRGTETAPFVRVRNNDINVIKPVLDLAPAGIIVPQVNSAAEAEAAVRSCRYPPRGLRGFGPRRGIRFGAMGASEYLQQATDDPIIVIQIEHIDAVNVIDEILAVDGIDIICFGPNDLSGSLHKLGQTNDPEVAAAIDRVADKVNAAQRILGVSTFFSPEDYTRWIKRGVKWISLNHDASNMFRGSKQVIDEVRKLNA